MRRQYKQRLHELVAEAFINITEILKEKGDITLFTQNDIDNIGNSEIDIYDNIPDFPFVDRHNYLEYVAIQHIRLDGETVTLSGVFKTHNFPEVVSISLDELESYQAIALADYLNNDHEY